MNSLFVKNNSSWGIYKIIDKTLYACSSDGEQRSFDFKTIPGSWHELQWIFELLPQEGVGSRREFSLYAATLVQHLAADTRAAACLEVVARKVADPQSVSDAELEQARKGAWAAYAAARDAAAAADAAAYAAAAAADAAAARKSINNKLLNKLWQLLINNVGEQQC